MSRNKTSQDISNSHVGKAILAVIVNDCCEDEGTGGKQGAATMLRGAGVLIDKNLVCVVECDEGDFVEVEIGVGVCVGVVKLSDWRVSSERMLSKAEGKEGLVDLGGDGGASEKEVLSHEYIIQDKAEVEDAFGQVQQRLLAVEEHRCNSALGRLFAHITGEHINLRSAVKGTSPFQINTRAAQLDECTMLVLLEEGKPIIVLWSGAAKPARVDGQIATRELQASKEEETERNSSLAEVDAEKDVIMMKERGSSFRETYTLLLHLQSFMKKVFVESAWNKSSTTKGEEHQVWISG
ncbi:uncharacterized protein MONOS_12714 [Monocercomonoides exilis]|uniref:uncharacterized protein n=1 Tax=Monocercomonoides exilis TaxID=2049356 RepID=UPI00355A410C|nr:hypothetical protein MONOS_12714 [Monocercomonoides exilis]|eukprot:MONOS_12714.1-p1 / transcript=MONOS_12714.1 / gene=MONOS_12714 / organism=Monocercomonoides_exilis_PA203 / gene_product=unspecified product / transcript_product=unspecified product / location=Mono_scaffold00724:520-1404(-) / protein_length=295 / sequence_SO=supercontig / SO=protein_coding / is_pseudo=false